MNTKFDICSIGNALVDLQFSVDESIITDLGLTIDQMTLASENDHKKILTYLQEKQLSPIAASGGSATNSLVAASYLGLSCAQLCRVAPDEHGQTFLRSLEDCQITCPQPINAPKSPLPTGTCIVLVTPDAKRTMSTHLGISADVTPEFIDEATLLHSKSIYLEGYMVTNETNLKALHKANAFALKHNKTRILSLSDPGVVEFFHSAFISICETPVDLLFCNEAEALAFTQTNTLSDAESALTNYCNTYVITRGPNGAIVKNKNEHHTLDGHPVKAIDSNGAGDIFAGAFLAYYLQKNSLKMACEFANHAAATLVQHFGPRLTKNGYLTLKDKLKSLKPLPTQL